MDTLDWKKCFRSRLLEQMNGLDDDDPTNDTVACKSLAISLFQAGDKRNAASIIATLFKTLEDYLEEKGTVETAAHDDSAVLQGGIEESSCRDANGTQGWEVVDRPVPTIVAERTLLERDMEGTPNITLHHEFDDPSDGTDIVPHIPTTLEAPSIRAPSSKASSVLELHLERDVWKDYRCHACDRDADDAGSMYLFLSSTI